MKKCLTALIIFLLVLIGAILLLPYSMGRIVQNNYLLMVNTLSTPQQQFKVVSYKRGWFSSQAIMQVDLTMANLSETKWLMNSTSHVDLVIKQTIQHGPWFFAKDAAGNNHLLFGQAFITSGIKQIQLIAANANTATAQQPAAGNANTSLAANNQQLSALTTLPTISIMGDNLTTFIQFDGLVNNSLHANQIIYKNPQLPVTYAINNLTAQTTFSPDLKKVQGDVSAAAMTISTSAFSQQMQDLTFGYDLQQAAPGFFVGEQISQVANITWNNLKTNNKIFLKNLAIKSNSQAQAGKANFAFDVKLANYGSDNNSYGPSDLSFTVNHIDIPSLILVRQQIADLVNQTSVSTLGLAKYNQLALLLLSKGLAFNLQKFDIATPWGTPDMKALIVFPAQAHETANPIILLNSMQADINLQIPAKFMQEMLTRFNAWSQSHKQPANNQTLTATDPSEQAQQQLQVWINNNWLIAQGNNYQVQITYKNQQPLINGNPFNFFNMGNLSNTNTVNPTVKSENQPSTTTH